MNQANQFTDQPPTEAQKRAAREEARKKAAAEAEVRAGLKKQIVAKLEAKGVKVPDEKIDVMVAEAVRQAARAKSKDDDNKWLSYGIGLGVGVFLIPLAGPAAALGGALIAKKLVRLSGITDD